MPKPISKCIFCGFTGKLTQEHIVSRRYHKLIPPTMGSYRMLRATELYDRSEFRLGKRAADPRDWQVRCVCDATCNNGWMRELEDDAEPFLTPLFTGQKIRLTPSQQAIVAAWLCLKSIVAEYETPDTTSVHHMHRKYLFRHRRPPNEGWAIWIGHHPRPRAQWVSHYVLHPFHFTRPRHPDDNDTRLVSHFNGAISTQVIGELFVQVIHGPKPFGVQKWKFPILPDGGMLRRIWPQNSFSIVWPPPPMSFRDEEVATSVIRNRLAAV